jgi:RimJ/RimL family protein N-acetyltransferase
MSSNHTIALNTWQYVAMTWNISDNTTRLYRNGMEVSYSVHDVGTGSVNDDSSHPFTIGARGALGNVTFFNGTIDEVYIWNTSLSAMEIMNRYTSYVAEPLPVFVISFSTIKDGTPVIIREPRPGDAGMAMEFINSISREKMSGILMTEKVTIKQEQAWLKNVLREVKKKQSVYLFAVRGKKLAGSCEITRMRYKRKHRAGLGIAITKDMRRKGLGEELVRRTILLAGKRMKGIETVELTTFSYNARAHKLYYKLGFKQISIIPRAVKEVGKYFDEFHMWLDLKNTSR